MHLGCCSTFGKRAWITQSCTETIRYSFNLSWNVIRNNLMKYDISISPHFIHAMWINIWLRAVHCIRIQLWVYFNVQFYTKCAVLNPFVQFLKHKCAVTKLTKIALIKTVFSFTHYPCGCSRKFQKCCH
jgi:hypothetical protein